MDFIKTKSSYIKQTKHSITKDGGIIFERDNSTLGGINSLTTQYPIYTSGNFVITVNNEVPVKRKIEKIQWETNGDFENWTLDNMSNIEIDNKTANENDIILNRDYYRLQDFAYYGSLTELIKVSIDDILLNFPGELYAPSSETTSGVKVIYTGSTEDGYFEKIMGSESYDGTYDGELASLGYEFLVENPFNLNLYVTTPPTNSENINKYVSIDNHWEDYVIIDNNNNIYDVVNKPTITTFDEFEGCLIGLPKYKIVIEGQGENGNVNFELALFFGNNNQLLYLTKGDYLGYHLRPKQKLYDDFINSTSLFEAYLLTKKESNITKKAYYTATFEIITETEQGYIKELKDFILPVDKGGYNIAVNSSEFSLYVKALLELGAYYDEHFTDNLYRSMTHESIKNFDWSFSREYDEEYNEEYIAGGNKMSNILHLFAREFDEVKSYIDAINYINVVTYDSKNNLPDYFLSDLAELNGWDLKCIYPFRLREYITINESDEYGCTISSTTIDYVSGDSFTDKDELHNSVLYNGEPFKLERQFTQMPLITQEIKPYLQNNFIGYGTFIVGGKEIVNSTSNKRVLLCNGCSHRRIMPYYNNKEFKSYEIYNEFLKRLSLNTQAIVKRKGTIEGIETILSLFGMKSKRWVDSLGEQSVTTQQNTNGLNSETVQMCDVSENTTTKTTKYYDYDYEIKEYTAFSRGLIDTYNEDKEETWINWYNNTKLLSYQDEGEYNGLPVSCEKFYEYDGKEIDEYTYRCLPNSEKEKCKLTHNILYPHFGGLIDGNPYYQMKGGWLQKDNFMFDKDNNIVLPDEGSTRNPYLFSETHSTNRAIDNLTEIANFKSDEFKDGDVIYVEDLSDDYVIVNGFDFYKIEEELLIGIEKSDDDEFLYEYKDGKFAYRYFYYDAKPNETKIGDIVLYDNLYASNPSYDYNDYEQYINIGELKDAKTIKVYLRNDDTFTLSDGMNRVNIIDYDVFTNKCEKATKTLYEDKANQDYTHYFILNNANFPNIYNEENGWRQLTENDLDYLRINTVIEKNKGNNPHIGHYSYDLGAEYINYFNYLFKYSYENDLINEDCFDDKYLAHLDNISRIGFQDLDDFNAFNGYYEYEDTKLHAFCDLIEQTRNNKEEEYDKNVFLRNRIGNLCEEGDLNVLKFGTDYTLSNISRGSTTYEHTNVGEYIINFDTNNTAPYGKIKYVYNTEGNDLYGQFTENLPILEIKDVNDENKTIIKTNEDVTNNLDQIMNIKRINIIFKMHTSELSEEGLEKKKYIDDVVMHYVEQMLPMNIICNVSYLYKEDEEKYVVNFDTNNTAPYGKIIATRTK